MAHLVALVSLSGSVTAAPLPPGTPPSATGRLAEERDLLRIAELRTHQRPLAASALATELLAADPEGPRSRELRYSRALALADAGLPRAADLELRLLLTEDPHDAVAATALRDLLAASGADPAAELLTLAGLLPSTAAPLPRRAADAFQYVQALDDLARGDHASARTHLGTIDGPLRGRAQAVQASLAHDQGAIAASAAALGRAYSASVDLGDPALHDQVALSAGRVTYGLGLWEAAAAHYARVQPTRPLWPDAREEQAWAFYQAGDQPSALGNVLALESALGARVPTPEADLIAGLARLEACHFDHARDRATSLEAGLTATVDAMDAWLAEATPETARASALGGSGLDNTLADDIPIEVWRAVVRDRDLVAHEQLAGALRSELTTIAQQKPVWRDSVGAALTPSLHAELERVHRQVGARILVRVRQQRAHFAHVRNQASVLAFEAVDGQRRMLEELARSPGVPVAGSSGPIDYAVATEQVYWPFNGEFWEDELDGYQVVLPSSCADLAGHTRPGSRAGRM